MEHIKSVSFILLHVSDFVIVQTITITTVLLPFRNFVPQINHRFLSVISGFRRNVDEIYALLGYYAAPNGKPLPTFRYNVSVPSWRISAASLDFLTLEDGTDTLSRNVGKCLPFDAV
jgi:hypothetical protein